MHCLDYFFYFLQVDNVKKTCNQSLTKLMDQLQRLELVNVNFHFTVDLHYDAKLKSGATDPPASTQNHPWSHFLVFVSNCGHVFHAFENCHLLLAPSMGLTTPALEFLLLKMNCNLWSNWRRCLIVFKLNELLVLYSCCVCSSFICYWIGIYC